jgi:hypothetical protein
LDDLDCRDLNRSRQLLLDAVVFVLQKQGSAQIRRFVGFAAPELEAWLIADWNHSFGTHPLFRGTRQQGMFHWLRTTGGVCFDDPESFGDYDPAEDSCKVKLSDMIIESSIQSEHNSGRDPYSKSTDTPVMLLSIDPARVSGKCPVFRELHTFLSRICV